MVMVPAETLFENIVETIREPLLVLDQDLRVVTVSRSFYEFFKVKPEETVGQLIYDLGNKQWDIPKLRELLENILPEKTVFDNYEVEHEFTTIGRRIMLLNARQIEREMGKERMILLAIEDITERKRAKDALHLQSKITAHMAEGVSFVRKSDTKFIFTNPKFEEMFGYGHGELIGKPVSVLNAPVEKKPEEIVTEIKAVLAQHGAWKGEVHNIKKDGALFWCYANVSEFDHPEHGKVMISVQMDITDRKQAEYALRKRMKELKCNYSITDMIGKSDTIVEILQKAVDIMPSGFNYPEITCARITCENQEFKTENFQETEWKISKDIFVDDKTIGMVEVCYLEEMPDRDGGPFLKEDCDLINAVAKRLGRTIERKKMASQLIQAQKMEAIGTLAGGIAHDFNNILSSVIGFTELSLDEVEKGTHIEDNLQEVYKAGKRARDLVKQILTFARHSEVGSKPIQVDTIATEVLKFIRSTIPTSIEIKKNIESSSLIMGNDTQVHQIFMNLFTNSAHAMEDTGGILEFSLKDIVVDRGVNLKILDLTPGNYIEIKVSDTGVGIAPEVIGSIFDPYFTTKGIGKGTGMGLATVHGIIDSYGGKISVDSKPGQGTQFTIYLPATRKRQEHRPYQSEELPTGMERILFVDDEDPIAKMGGQVLERLGYTVSIRTSSIEALELFRTKPDAFDLVITDTTMPNMTGDRLAIELIKIKPDIPVILCTGYSKKISEKSVSEMGIKALIYKPIIKADLAKTVRKVLDEAKKKT